ncbi:hypothetical protein L596_024807 [Steinernema carpocapsae]|uniref:Enoyl-CoA hydratase n=1 Tax=Steinernema carpocapsae TaxID=34508 RepID=A0A4U5M5U5_STECR|nr:hypothetical protein L596_024807 [Steinernema carpocapsae]
MSTVNVTPYGEILLIGINRPKKRNCVNHETAKQLVSAFERFENYKEFKVAILYGEGGTFCAGYDLNQVAKGQFPPKEFLDKYRFMGPSLMRFSKPIIGAIEGYAVSCGLEISLMCDLRVVAKSAKFGIFCRRLGCPLLDGGTVRLPKLIGMSRAMDMILTGREVDAKTPSTGVWPIAWWRMVKP